MCLYFETLVRQNTVYLEIQHTKVSFFVTNYQSNENPEQCLHKKFFDYTTSTDRS